ncbi:hypothetical protein JTB14_028224 [Gonioctena quinquepunctata]|nr:hypothetical protein JTB14_028224 [Gonioctena quinquepunctata]
MAGNVMRSKSSHALAVPQKQYEAGNKSPQPLDHNMDSKVLKRSINRIRTSEKVSAYHQTPGLSRSRTLPDIVCPPLLDEKNIVSTQNVVSEGPLKTTTQVTRVTTKQEIGKKPLSPFAKFRQLDKQNSINTPPSTPGTPKTPFGSGPLFKFTDPAVSQSASTIKDRLLFWCRMKTKEYEV